MKHIALVVLPLPALLLLLAPGPGQETRPHSLVVETADGQHYFHVRFDWPANRFRGGLATPSWWEATAPDATPRLVPVDDRARLVCTVTGDNLEFVGRYDPKADSVKARLLSPTAGANRGSIAWKEVEVVLDFKTAGKGVGLARKWATAQTEQFADLAGRVHDFGFYSFAATATARKYDVPTPRQWSGQPARFDFVPARLYELTTGATAITESLQLRRMTTGPTLAEERTVGVHTLPGIDIREHPWEQMMGGQKPANELLARMIPHDNYYVAFRDLAKVVEFAGLLELWGGNLTRSFEFTSRDYRLWDRYERQLGLASAALSKNAATLGIRGIGITGNDAYLRDGTDLTILFRVDDPKPLLAALDAGIEAARKQYGRKLTTSHNEVDGVRIESAVAPLREVSVHRAVVDGVVVVSNSHVALWRVIASAKGHARRLAESRDFQYMRVVFRADDPAEDGFLYLPDAFVRKFVGPESRIKQKRRLEALVGLHLMTNGALFTAWETGKLPTSAEELLRLSGLKANEIAMPDGSIDWDAERGAAVSKVYGSLHFATPLIELSATQVTPAEASEYAAFRQEYLRLWRRFFDPIGMRLALRGGQVKLETYILPLIESAFYQDLRRWTGNGTAKLDLASISPRTLIQYTMHIDKAQLPLPLRQPALELLGERIHVRLDDGPEMVKLLDPKEWNVDPEAEPSLRFLKAISEVPLAVGIEVKDPKQLAKLLKGVLPLAKLAAAGQEGWVLTFGDRNYRNVAIVRLTLSAYEGKSKTTLSYAIFGGNIYATLNEAMMDRLIDEGLEKKAKGGVVEINSSLHVSPTAVGIVRPALERLVEAPTRHEARSALALWYALHRCGLVRPGSPPSEAAEAAFRILGFVPAAPDRTGYRYDRTADELVNDRHGSFRVPMVKPGLAESSPLNRLLDTVQAARIDLRFREDGIHTTLTIDRSWTPERQEKMTRDEKAQMIAELTAALRSPDRTDRRHAATRLALFGPEAKASVPVLQIALFDFAEEVRIAAEATLKKIDPEAVRPETIDPWARELVRTAQVAALSATDVEERRWAVECLRKLGAEATGSLRDGLAAALKASHPHTRLWAVRELGRMGAEARAVVPVLIASLLDDNKALRGAVAEALARIDATTGPEVLKIQAAERVKELAAKREAEARLAQRIRALTADLRSPLRGTRLRAAQVLGEVGSAARTAIPALEEAEYDPSREVQAAATAALEKIRR